MRRSGSGIVRVVRPIIWTSEPVAQALRAKLSSPPTIVRSAKEFAEAKRDPGTVCFVDSTTLSTLQGTPPGPTVAVCDDPLQAAIGWLGSYPWLGHVISTAMLSHPYGAEHLRNVTHTLASTEKAKLLDWLGPRSRGAASG